MECKGTKHILRCRGCDKLYDLTHVRNLARIKEEGPYRLICGCGVTSSAGNRSCKYLTRKGIWEHPAKLEGRKLTIGDVVRTTKKVELFDADAQEDDPPIGSIRPGSIGHISSTEWGFGYYRLHVEFESEGHVMEVAIEREEAYQYIKKIGVICETCDGDGWGQECSSLVCISCRGRGFVMKRNDVERKSETHG